MTVEKHYLQKDSYNDPSSDQPWFDNTCIYKMYDHELARDCPKVKCICYKKHDHLMVLDGIQGFPPTAGNNKPA